MKARYNNVTIEKFEHDTILVHSLTSKISLLFDPFQSQGEFRSKEKVDIVFLSHDHYDHFSPKDILAVSHEETKYIFPASILDKITTFLDVPEERLVPVVPLEEYKIKTSKGSVTFMAVPAYNIDKRSPQGNLYHPKERGYVGYVISLDGDSVYFTGDTDVIPEMNVLKGKIEVLLLPVSGVYVMTAQEAVEAVNVLGPALAIPMHYGSIVGNDKMAEEFRQLVFEKELNVKVELL